MKQMLTLALAAAALAGCASSITPAYDEKFGQAVSQARLAQTIQPAPTPMTAASAVGGIDGKAAREAMVRYQDSFRSPPPVVNVININGAGGGR